MGFSMLPYVVLDGYDLGVGTMQAGRRSPFARTVAIFVLAAIGLVYNLYPCVVVDRLTAFEAASSPEALKFILVGVAISVPAILAYTVFAYRVFWGKASSSHYG